MIFKNLLFITPMALSLCACSQAFDFSKKSPDEFAVITRAPLEIPDNFDLPTPQIGAPRPQEASPEEQAKKALFGGDIGTQTTLSSGESILLQKAGAVEAGENIRATIDAETRQLAVENRSTVDRILGKVGKKSDAPVTVIDPVKERERLILEQQQ